MKSNNAFIKKAFELYAKRQVEKIPSDDNINLEFSENFDARIKTHAVFTKKTPSLKRMVLAAACLIITVCLALSMFTLLGKRDTPPALTVSNTVNDSPKNNSTESSTTEDHDTEYGDSGKNQGNSNPSNNNNDGTNNKEPTTELNTRSPVKENTNAQELTPYKNLDELLEKISANDNHGKNDGTFYVSSNASGTELVRISNKVLQGDYLYLTEESYDTKGTTCSLNLYKLEKDNSTLIKTVFSITTEKEKWDSYTDYIEGILLYKDKLVIVINRDSFTAPSYTLLMFDNSDNMNPRLIKTFEQVGTLSACFFAKDKIYLIGSDGECVCGYTRLKDKSGYIPSLIADGKNIKITDDDIIILGSPSRVTYTAVSVIDALTGSISDYKAFYGDIRNLYCGTDYFAFSAQTEKLSQETYKFEWISAETLYVFTCQNQKIAFQGKLTLNDLFGFPLKFDAVDGNYENENYVDFRIENIIRSGDDYRITGSYNIGSFKDGEAGYIVGLFDKNLNTKFLIAKQVQNQYGVKNIFNEEQRQILRISIYNKTDVIKYSDDKTLYVTIDYSAEKPVITESKNYIEGFDKSYDSDGMIKIKDNVYLTYHCKERERNGFNLLDFTDPANVKTATLSLNENCRIYSKIYSVNGVYGACYMVSEKDSTGKYQERFRAILFKVNTENNTLEKLCDTELFDIQLPDNKPRIIEFNGSYYPLIG